MEEKEGKELSYGWLKFRPGWLQFFNTPKWFLFFLCQYFFTQSIIVNGVYPGSISTIEKRFGFTSYLSGMLTSSYDMAALALTPLVSYIGGSRKKPVFCAWGVFTMGVGFFIFMLPHFISPPYQPDAVMSVDNATVAESNGLGLCAGMNRTDFSLNDECDKTTGGGNDFYYALFILGMVVAGAGCTPMYALGVPYIDENVKAKVSPMYVGLFVASGIVGAAVGFVIISRFLLLFVELGVTTSLTILDKRWVGNWWLGFAIFGALCVFWSIWLLGFPKEFLITKKQREMTEALPDTRRGKDGEFSALKDLPKATKLVFSRLPFVFITLGACMDNFISSASVAFMPKVIEMQFYLPPGRASLLYGVITIPCALLGNLTGAYINKRLKMNMTYSARMCFIIALLGTTLSSFLYIKCETPSIAGVNKPYQDRLNPIQLSAPCNQACNCRGLSYSPVCGGSLTFYSPCHAGCSNLNETTKAGSFSFSSCACVSHFNQTSGEAKKGYCNVDCGLKFVLFLSIVSLMTFLTLLNNTPGLIVTLRSVPVSQQAYALGHQMNLMRILGAIPGPIVYGALLDSTCILWSSKCGERGYCLEYDHAGLAKVVLGVALICRLITTVCFGLSWFFCRRLVDKEKSYGEDDVNHNDTGRRLVDKEKSYGEDDVNDKDTGRRETAV